MKVTEGVLRIVSIKGKNVCPLKHTEVKANISGFIGITEVTQIFTNPMDTPIEAEYIFPLTEKSAVFEMLMKIGDKTIKGIVKEKEEAREIYNKAIKKGKRASLLDEERPNVFVQHVGNIMPNDEIKILIKYVEDIKFEEGIYEYVFPMTVAPRYIPKSMEGKEPKVNPAYVEEGKRAGHDISLSVEINSPINIEEINSELHEINIEKISATTSKIKLAEHDSIPNRDFILRYRVGSETIEEGLISTKIKDKGGFASLIIQPPSRPENYNIIPKEMIFVVDTSGSQIGAPLEVCKKAMNLCIDKMHKNDTFNIICFSDVPEFLFKKSMPNNRKNRELAREFMKKHDRACGGTEMLTPILEALNAKRDPERLRIITVMTDGCIGNEGEIISAIAKKCKKNTRVFSFGTGNSVNRYLITKMAEAGRGESEIITVNNHPRGKEKKKQNENIKKITDAFFKKIDCPLMTDIKLTWSGAKLSEIYPKVLPDLYSNTPLILIGKYKESTEGSVIITGKTANGVIEKKIDFKLNPEDDPKYESIPYLWARRKIEYYSDEDEGSYKENSKIKEKIIKLGIKFGLVTKYTSFVAVEEKIVNKNGKITKKEVPAKFPSGVSREGFEHTSIYLACVDEDCVRDISASDFGDLDIDDENDEPCYNIDTTEDNEDIFDEIKPDEDKTEDDDSCLTIDTIEDTDNGDIFAGIKSDKYDSENDDSCLTIDTTENMDNGDIFADIKSGKNESENDEPCYDIDTDENTDNGDIFADLKSDKDNSESDDSCLTIDTTENMDNDDILVDVKSDKYDSENDGSYYSLAQLSSKVRKKLKLFKYDEDKFDKYLNALFETIKETQKKAEYDLKFLKDELKKSVKRQVIDKNGKIKVKIKFITVPEDTLKLIEANEYLHIVKKEEEEVIVELDVNRTALLNLIEISENSSVDKIELAKSSRRKS